MHRGTATIPLQTLCLFLVAALLLCLPQPSLAAGAETRIALVIGNGAYKAAPLRNPAKDARDMAALLTGLGFSVTLKMDAGQKDMEEAVRQFGLDLRQGGVGLFYFAGHGLQVQGSNYLVPVDAKIQTESDVRFECVDAGRVLGKMEDAGNALNIVILDACRNNPFSRGFRSADRGLAEMRAPTGSIIAYATAPGSVASDGSGENGVYTKHLLSAMRTPDLAITDVFMRVRMGVVSETGKKQVPWESSSLTGYFYLTGEGKGGAAAAPTPAAAPSVDLKAEKRRIAEEAERLRRDKEELAQLQALQAEKERLEAERQKLMQAKQLAMAQRPKQPPPALAPAPAAGTQSAQNAQHFGMLARHGVGEAQRYFEGAVQARPDDADARSGLAVAYLLSKREADAKYHVRRVEESGRNTAATRVARGFMLGVEGQLADSSYQLNRALEEGADRALVQLAMAAAAAKKNEMDQAKKAMEEYRALVPPVEENDYAKELARKVDLQGRLVGTFLWTMENKSISAYTSTITFMLNNDQLAATAGGYGSGAVSNLKLTGKTLTLRVSYGMGLFGTSHYDLTCDLSGDLDAIPTMARESTFGQTWNGFLLRQGSLAQSMAYHANPAECFIATAAYGGAFDEHVATLRRFRDGVLLKSRLGRDLAAAYYRLSPPLADAIRERPLARAAARTALAPVVLLAGAANGEAESIVWLIMSAAIVVAAAAYLARRRRRPHNAERA